jgi:4-hydroxybenzoate polyprenyltransferase
MTSSSSHTDIQTTHIIYRLTPRKIWPYLSLMRLDRPIGTWLLLLPAWWAMAMEIGGVTQIHFTHFIYFCLFGVGAVIMRGAGCVINDLWDRDIDKAVERTKNRPLASGQITIRQAMYLLGGLLLLGLLILIQLPKLAILFGILSLIPVILYPLAKRVTWYPQAILGLTFNFGALIGAATISQEISTPALLLYSAGFFWTLGYDTIYAHQDIMDDGIVGIKSTALRFGNHSKAFISFFYILFLGLVYLTGVLTDANFIFYGLWMGACFHILWQIRTWDISNPADCLHKFRGNRDSGLIVLCAYLGGYISLI